jgi:hypothetical protein
MRPNYPSTTCATALIFKAVSEHHAGDTGERMTSNLPIYNWSTASKHLTTRGRFTVNL